MSGIALQSFKTGWNFSKDNFKNMSICVLKMIPLYILIAILGFGLGMLFGVPIAFNFGMSFDIQISQEAIFSKTGLVQTLIHILKTIAITPLLVSIHRAILLNEPFNRSVYFRLFNKRELKYAAWLLAFEFLALLPSMVTIVGLNSLPTDSLTKSFPNFPYVAYTLLFISIVVFVYLFLRFSYLLSALATDKEVTLQTVMQKTSNKAGKMFQTTGLVVLAFLVIGFLMGGTIYLIAQKIHFTVTIMTIFTVVAALLTTLLMIMMIGTGTGAISQVFKTLESQKAT